MKAKSANSGPISSGLARRKLSERRGRRAEWLAAGLLMIKGYRILARRAHTPFGEIDLIAVRGRRVAFVEVKWRKTLELAVCSVSPRQAGRIAKAADYWLWRRCEFRDHEMGFDCVFAAPGHFPRHAINALQPT